MEKGGNVFPAGSEVWNWSGNVRSGSMHRHRWAEKTATSQGKRCIRLAANGDTAQCQRLTQQGLRGQGAMRPHLPFSLVSASGTNLFQRLRTDRRKTCHARLEDLPCYATHVQWCRSYCSFTRVCWYASLGG